MSPLARLLFKRALMSSCERICEPNAAKRCGQRGMRCDRPDVLRALTCIFETCAPACNSHWLAHALEVESWPVRGVFGGIFLLRTCCLTSPTASRSSGRLVCYLV
jgi:hypothetical protein